MNHTSNALAHLDQSLKKSFEKNKMILSFDEYLQIIESKHLRGSSAYAVDMLDFFGKKPVPNSNSFEFDLFTNRKILKGNTVVGHQLVITKIYQSLKTFARLGINNKLLLLHGPNGSAKSSITQALMMGLEAYSLTDEGALYSFNWVFPLDKISKGANSSLGIQAHRPEANQVLHSYSKLKDDEIQSRLTCELKDHPLLIIPAQYRQQFIESHYPHLSFSSLPIHLQNGELCHRCKLIFDSLLNNYQGDFKKVLNHIQVERYFLSKKYRKGLVSIEPQMHVDAQFQLLTMNRSISTIPNVLHNINLFSVSGDLVDGNKGVIEFNDLLKRPVDAYKYLLFVCETGSVGIGHSIASIDTVWIGSTNELQLDAFKEYPDFTSFKGRMELIRVPYLLNYQEEEEIYLEDLKQINLLKHVSPHVAKVISLWAILTRLKKPNAIHYPPFLSGIVSNLSPLEKAKLYANGEMPNTLSPEEKKILRSNLDNVKTEYENIPFYEGRVGASARELKSIIANAAQSNEFTCLSPLSILKELEEFTKRVSEHEFLKQEIKDGYHDAYSFIQTVRNEYLNWIDREVRESMGLYDSKQWEDFVKKYIHLISLVLKKEKFKNSVTGKMEDPDFSLIGEFEKIVEAPTTETEQELFRQNIISQVGAWSIDHPKEPVIYSKIFPDFWAKLEKHYYETQKGILSKMYSAIPLLDQTNNNHTDESSKLAQQTIQSLIKNFSYCDHCAKEAISFLIKNRY